MTQIKELGSDLFSAFKGCFIRVQDNRSSKNVGRGPDRVELSQFEKRRPSEFSS